MSEEYYNNEEMLNLGSIMVSEHVGKEGQDKYRNDHYTHRISVRIVHSGVSDGVTRLLLRY